MSDVRIEPKTEMLSDPLVPAARDAALARVDRLIERARYLFGVANVAHFRRQPDAAEKTRAAISALEAVRAVLLEVIDRELDDGDDEDFPDDERLVRFIATELRRGRRHSAASIEKARDRLDFTRIRLIRALKLAEERGRIARRSIAMGERAGGFNYYLVPCERGTPRRSDED